MNIEITLIEYLNSAVSDIPTYAEVPESPTGEFFVVDKTGSDTENGLCTTTVAIQSYADTKLKASQLNERLIGVMDGLTALDGVSDCKLITDYNFTNVAKKQHRYQAVFEITHY
jgi:hypothetical protein